MRDSKATSISHHVTSAPFAPQSRSSVAFLRRSLATTSSIPRSGTDRFRHALFQGLVRSAQQLLGFSFQLRSYLFHPVLRRRSNRVSSRPCFGIASVFNVGACRSFRLVSSPRTFVSVPTSPFRRRVAPARPPCVRARPSRWRTGSLPSASRAPWRASVVPRAHKPTACTTKPHRRGATWVPDKPPPPRGPSPVRGRRTRTAVAPSSPDLGREEGVGSSQRLGVDLDDGVVMRSTRKRRARAVRDA